jgi:hypothetical protein
VIVRHLLMPLALTAMAACCGQAAAQGAFPAPLPNQSSQSNQSSGSASPFPPVNQSAAAPQPAAASPFPPVNGAPAQPAAAGSAFPNPSSSNAAASQGVFSQGARPLGGGLGGGGFGAASPPPQQEAGGTAEQEECLAKFAPMRVEAEKRAKQVQAASERKAPPQEACNLIKAYVQAEARLVSYVTTKQTACGIPPDIPKQLKTNQARSQQMQKVVCQAAAQPQGRAAAAPSLSEVLGSPGAAPDVRTVRGGSTFDTINGNVLAR